MTLATEAGHNRQASKQDHETPADFLAAVVARFGPLHVDLACRRDNAKAPLYLTEEIDSLSVGWARMFPGRTMWLNPPFNRIAPWAEKCACEAIELARTGGRILMLTPASVGSEWFTEHVHDRARVHPLSPRLTFVGQTQPFPKDCILSVYGELPGFLPWRWKARAR